MPKSESPTNVPQPGPEATEATTMKPIDDWLASGPTAPKRFALPTMTFPIGESTLSADGQDKARELATLLNAHPGAKLQIQGFSDGTGNAQTNQQLAQSRAETVKSVLTANGVDGSRIQTSGQAEAGTAQNRRVEVVIAPR
jgi:outer membrane protein OmpA-like peptidoglycan-associated protein